jgi:hypothetical protein
MTHKLPALVIFALAVLASPAARGADTAHERIEAACKATLKPDYRGAKLDKICACVRRNYEAHRLSEEELDLLVRSHEQDPAAEQELQKEKWEDALLFDYDVTDGCVKKPTYRYP